MQIRKLVAGASVLATLSLLATAGQVQASDTSAFFTITGGGLSISAPAPAGGVDLGSISSADVLAGSVTVAGQLGNVTVTDERAALTAAWTATVASTEFVLAGATNPAASEKVATTNIAYMATDLAATLAGTTVSGTGTFVPGVVASMDLLAASRIAGTWTGTGSNSVTWNPTVTMTLLSSQVAGKYTGTVTHSVA